MDLRRFLAGGTLHYHPGGCAAGRGRWLLVGAGMVVAAVMAACGSPAHDDKPLRTYQAGEAVCEAGRRSPAAEVHPDIHTVGSASNVITRGDGYLWVVASNDNTVGRFDPTTDTYDEYFIDVGSDRNPYDIHIDADKHAAYITNWVADTLTVADTKTGRIVDEIGVDADDFDAPEGVTATEERIYVTNTHFSTQGYGDGSVTVVDRDTRNVVAHVATAQKNPQFAEVFDTADGPRVVVVSTGKLNASGQVLSDGAVEVWRETSDPGRPDRQIFTLAVTDDSRMGAPGRPVITPDRSRIYMPSATAPVVFEFDLRRGAWIHDTSNPLVAYPSDQKALDSAVIDGRGILYLAAFNDDALYLIDTTCDAVLAGPIDLGTSGLVEGPQDIQVASTPRGPAAFFVTGLSNAMGRIDLSY